MFEIEKCLIIGNIVEFVVQLGSGEIMTAVKITIQTLLPATCGRYIRTIKYRVRCFRRKGSFSNGS